MEALKLLPLFLLLLVACVSAKKYKIKKIPGPEPKSKIFRGWNGTEEMKVGIESGSLDNDSKDDGSGNGEDDDAYDDENMSEEEKKKLLEFLINEGKPGWFQAAIKQAKKTAEKMRTENTGNNRDRKSKDSPKKSNDNSEPPTSIISNINSKLSVFNGPLASRVKTSISGLSTKWSNLDDDQKEGIAGTLGVISGSIEKFADASDNPTAAIQATIDIIGSVASNFGPIGQLVSMGLGFVSALLGLFGGGPKPKPIDEIVREEINKALSEYRDQTLTDKAKGLATAFGLSKAYLDSVAALGEPLNLAQVQIISSRVPIIQGAEFMGELLVVIKDLYSKNKAEDAKKCIKYCELYAQLTALRDMIFMQLISLSSDDKNLQFDVNGLIAFRDEFRRGAKVHVFQPLYTVKYGNKILPYFDPDISVITDAFATSIFNLGKDDRLLAGLYCLEASPEYDLDWQTEDDRFKLEGKPYVSLKDRSNDNCYWKLVPHGGNTYSIINKYRCDEPDYDWCGAMLSFDAVDGTSYVNIDHYDPVLWEITEQDILRFRRIRSKWGCQLDGSTYCDLELRIKQRRTSTWLRWYTLPVGQLLPSDGWYYWKLRKRT